MRLVVALVMAVLATACSDGASPVRDRAAEASPEATPVVANEDAQEGSEPVSGSQTAESASPAVPTSAPQRQTSDEDRAETSAAGCVQRPGIEDAPPTLSGPAEAGTYVYDVDGTFEVDARRNRSGKLPDETTRVRGEPATDATGTRWTEQRRGEQGESTSHLVLAGNELKLEKIVTNTRRADREFTPVPPITVLRFPLGEAATWESTGTDGSATVTARAKVLRRDVAEVCGSPYGVWVVESWTKTVAAQATSDTHSVSWIATQLGALVLRTQHDTKTTTQGNELRTRSTERLRSIVPE